MAKYILTIIISLLASIYMRGEVPVQWSEMADEVITVKPEASTGLEAIYVAPALDGVRLSYTGDGPVTWYSYSSMGGGYAEEVGTAKELSSVKGDTGYILETADGGRYCFWVTDYSRHPLTLGSVAEAAEQECGLVSLDVTGQGDEIVYYAVNGRRLVLSRDITLSYNTLEWDKDNTTYAEKPVVRSLEALTATIHAPAPLCATDFTLAGDRFLRAWGREQRVTSPSYAPKAVACQTAAEQETRDADNEVGALQGSLGGSAPCIVNFSAQVTDAAIFREWQFSRRADFEDVSLRVNDLDFNYSFEEQGTHYVRFVCANADASCDAEGETYEISIGTSMLKCPNAFSPRNEDGVNDLWKVTYSSIVSFECSIFNRTGRCLYSYNNPADGWDGRYGGKLVPAGVYFYVIKALGADGRKYNLSGDINILDYK